jgi:hypothetical protein
MIWSNLHIHGGPIRFTTSNVALDSLFHPSFQFPPNAFVGILKAAFLPRDPLIQALSEAP